MERSKITGILFSGVLLCMCILSHFSHVRVFANWWTVAQQAPLSMGFSRQEYWSKLPCPPLGDLSNLGIKPVSLLHLLYWQMGSLPLVPPIVFKSVTQSCLTLCNPMDCTNLTDTNWCMCLYHQLPELAETHVHWFSDAIQPSHPLLSHSPPAFSLSQHQGLFQWVSSSHQVVLNHHN